MHWIQAVDSFVLRFLLWFLAAQTRAPGLLEPSEKVNYKPSLTGRSLGEQSNTQRTSKPERSSTVSRLAQTPNRLYNPTWVKGLGFREPYLKTDSCEEPKKTHDTLNPIPTSATRSFQPPAYSGHQQTRPSILGARILTNFRHQDSPSTLKWGSSRGRWRSLGTKLVSGVWAEGV